MKRNPSEFCVIALGSNLGDAKANVLSAIAQLREVSPQPLLVSSLWKTEPVGCPPGSASFVNAAVAFLPHPNETPESLLRKLQGFEKQFGRRPKLILNEPRPLDLDLISFRNEVRSSPELILPHPRARERRFVLEPLSEVLPSLILPGERKTVRALLADLPKDPGVVRLA